MENSNNSLEELKKAFIINKEEYEKQKLPDYIKRTLKYCKINSEGGVHIENFSLTIRDKIAISLTARFLANQLQSTINPEISGDELSTFLDVEKPVIYARLKDLCDIKMIKRLEKGTYQIVPYYIESLLDELDAKYQIKPLEEIAENKEANDKINMPTKKYSSKTEIVVDENFQKEVIDKIDKSKYTYILNLNSFDMKTLAILDMARKDFKKDGLTSSEIIKILTDKFRIKAAWSTISNALKKLDQKGYVDSKQAEGHPTKRVYRIMTNGENYLKEEIAKL